jgi:hypothetical protein
MLTPRYVVIRLDSNAVECIADFPVTSHRGTTTDCDMFLLPAIGALGEAVAAVKAAIPTALASASGVEAKG